MGELHFPKDYVDKVEQMHEKMLYPTVLVEAKKGVGSGTVVYSEPNPDPKFAGEYETYVLTNHHVIEANIQTGKQWNPLKQKEEKKDVFATVNVYFYKYKYGSRNIGKNSVEADIVAYTKEEDMALLRLRSIDKINHVTKFYPLSRVKEIKMFMKTYAVGAALGHQPIATDGWVTCMSDEQDNFVYWMSTAQIIFGNSGGSMYIEADNDYWFIGVPSMVAVTFSGFSASAVTHMGYFIPIERVCAFMDRNFFGFIHDRSLDPLKCAEDRSRVKKIAAAQKELLDLEA